VSEADEPDGDGELENAVSLLVAASASAGRTRIKRKPTSTRTRKSMPAPQFANCVGSDVVKPIGASTVYRTAPELGETGAERE
jgi:hypothetical protein